jgi:serine/threonine protein kinase
MQTQDLMVGQVVGAYRIVNKVGQGGMGVVYQAMHTTLERPAAIKFLSPELLQDRDYVQRFFREARAAAHLDHPHIVGIYDAGEIDDMPYLVMEYVKGEDLGQRLKRQTKIEPKLTISLIRQAANALSYAHRQGMVHRDIKPANLLISDKETLKVADLGLAKFRDEPEGEQTRTGGLMGTPYYMAPELIMNSRLVDARCDIYALGATVYRVVSGRTPYPGTSATEIFSQRMAGPPVSLKSVCPAVDDHLCSLIERMMEADPAKRYQTMEEVEAAMAHWESGKPRAAQPPSAAIATPPPPQDLLDLLNKRITARPDLPSHSATISRIVAISENKSVDDLTNVILADFGLTNKILRLVNTVYYSAYVGRVSTISRAILVLGVEQIKNIAVSLLLFESLQDKGTAEAVRGTCARSFVAGQIARDVAKQAGYANTEEAFVCSAFHNLGKLLVTFYFTEHYAQIVSLVETQGMDWENAASKVIGMSFEELGIRMAQQWQLPTQVVNAMKRPPAGALPPAENEEQQLRNIAFFSSELCEVMESTGADAEAAAAACVQLSERYAQCLPTTPESVARTLKNSLNEVDQLARRLSIKMADTPLLSKARKFTQSVSSTPPAAGAKAASADQKPPASAPAFIMEPITPAKTDARPRVPAGMSSMDELFDSAGDEPSVDPDKILEQGIQDVTHSMMEESSMNDVLRMILEVMYRALNFHKVIFCIKNLQTQQIAGRYGLGPGVQTLLPDFKFSIGGDDDIFNLALAQGVDLIVPDIQDEQVRKFIPRWYHKLVAAQTFVVLPLLIKTTPLGLIYMDKLKADGIVISPSRLNHLRTLRDQGILAMRKKPSGR